MPLLTSTKNALRHRGNRCKIVLLLSAMLITNAGAQQPVAREFQIKAVFLFNFAQFVQWPAQAFEQPDSPLVIGVVGNDPFGSYLDETVRGEKLEDHPLVVERYPAVSEIGNCHILFVAATDKQEMRRALEAVSPGSVLTVSDIDNFARSGGMVQLYNDAGRIRLRINVEPAEEAGLTISSKLLRLADIVTSRND